VLVGGRAHSLKVVGVLQLTCGLLDLLVGNLEAGEFVAKTETDAVAISEVTFVAQGKIAGRGLICKILRNYWTQVAVGHVTTGAGR